MATSIRPDLSALRAVLAHYDIGPLQQCSLPAGGRRSHTWLITTDKERYILKRYPETFDSPAVEFEHSLLEYLRQVRFPAPRLVQTRQGGTWLALDGHLYACFEFIEGICYSDYFLLPSTKTRYLTQAAQTLAYYHSIVADLVPSGRKMDGFRPRSHRRWHDREWYLQEMEICREIVASHSRERRRLARWEEAHSRLARLWDAVEGSDAALPPSLPIHGDYGPYNLFYNDGRLVAVIDFECAHLDWRLTEVLSATVRFAGRDQGLSLPRARQFLQAYHQANPLTVEEQRIAPKLFALGRLRNMVKALIRFREKGTEASLLAAERMLDWADKAAIWKPLLEEAVR